MQVLLLSIMAKCGVFTHVRDLAVHLKKKGFSPIIGFLYNSATMSLFKVSREDRTALEQTLVEVPYFYYDTLSSLVEKAKELETDIVHAHSPIVLKHAAYIKYLLHIPFVITLHGVIDWSRHYGTELKMADKIIAVGPEVRESCGNNFHNKVTIIYNGIDTEYFKPDENRTTNHPLRIIWIGRTSGSAARGAECLSLSLNKLKKSGIPFEAKIVGYPFGVNTHGIEYCGWVHDPLPLLQWSDIAFGRGRSLREAMACGNAGFLLAEGYGGLVHSKWFENGNQPQLSGSLKHGYLKLDPTRIARDILYFHKHRDHLESIRRDSRLISVTYFDIKKMVDEVIAVYEEAASPNYQP
ncbi:MAG TPA: glycosyltransferase family 4 protein [Clostridiales bacterium]|nr:glycosyltransferase family 4 protein [Clostridiales bacterium]